MRLDGVEALDVVVARAKVREDAHIDVVAPREVAAGVGQTVRLRFLFSLEETSRDKDEWHFRLSSSFGEHARPAVEKTVKDRWGIRDDMWGLLQQDYRFDRPGVYEGEVSVRAENLRGKWNSNQILAELLRTQEAPIRIVVRKAAV